MDSKPQMPDIKPEVNREDDKKAPGGGFLSNLFGGGGAAGSAGGAAGGAASAAAGGGLLATKAGLVAMVLIGTSVAGGIGLTGYRMFGPTAADRAGGGNIEVFSAKPRAAAPAEGGAAATGEVANGGASGSLDMMSQAAGKDAPEEAKPAGDAATDATAASAAATQTAGTSNGPINSGGGAAASAFRNLAGTKKLGELSKNFAGGGSAPSSGGASAKPVFDSTSFAAAKAGATSAMNRGGGAGVLGGRSAARRGATGGGNRGAMSQLRGVNGANAGYSGGAHSAYDGAGSNGIGADGGSAITMEGAGAGGGAADKEIAANSAANENKMEYEDKREVPVDPPWQKDLDNIQMYMMLIMALVAAAAVIENAESAPGVGTFFSKAAKYIIGGAILAFSALMIAAANKVRSGYGEFSQENAGNIGMLVGVLGAAIGTYIMVAPAAGKTKDAELGYATALGGVNMTFIMIGAAAGYMLWGQQVKSAQKKYEEQREKKLEFYKDHPTKTCPDDKITC